MAIVIKLLTLIITLFTVVSTACPPAKHHKKKCNIHIAPAKKKKIHTTKHGSEKTPWITRPVKNKQLFRVNHRSKKGEVKGVMIYDASQFDQLIDTLLSFKNLQSIFFYDTSCTELSSSLSRFPHISHLSLDMKNLTVLPKGIGELKNLTMLTIRCPKITCIDTAVLDLPKLDNLTIQAALTKLPPISSRIRNVNLPGNRLETISWHYEPQQNKKRRSMYLQHINLENNPIKELPHNLRSHYWKKSVSINCSYEIPPVPITFKMTPRGAYLHPFYPNMPIDNSQVRLQWHERITGTKEEPQRDTARYQMLHHPSGLPLISGSRGGHMLHGHYYSSVINEKTGIREVTRKKKQYPGIVIDSGLGDTTFHSDTLIAQYKKSPGKFIKGFRHGELNDSTYFYAESVKHKKSDRAVTFNDGTPYFNGRIFIITPKDESQIAFTGEVRAFETRTDMHPMSLQQWKELPGKEKAKLVELFIKRYRYLLFREGCLQYKILKRIADRSNDV